MGGQKSALILQQGLFGKLGEYTLRCECVSGRVEVESKTAWLLRPAQSQALHKLGHAAMHTASGLKHTICFGTEQVMARSAVCAARSQLAG